MYRFGKYDLIAHLATGGMAEIYLARQSGIGGFEKLLVIKRIAPHLAREKQFVEMFFDEARIAAQLNHPNIVQIYDLGQADRQFYIAMEYLEGESLAEVIRQMRKQRKPLAPSLCAGITLQMLEGLHYAHTFVGPDGQVQNIVHRDINPQNIFILYTGGVKLVDFGIAKATNRFSKTETGMLKGKYGYMSPEQIKNMPLDARSDIYSAGVALWEMLTGRKLFRQTSELEILQAITELDQPPPSSINPAVPKELDTITLKALQRSRPLRYQSAAQMRMELSFALKGGSKPSDTVAIGELMDSLFHERMMEKRSLVQKAQGTNADLGDILFDSIDGSRSDTEPSISPDTPSYINPLPSPKNDGQERGMEPTPVSVTQRTNSRFMWLSVIAAGVIGALVVVVAFWLMGKTTERETSKTTSRSTITSSKNPVQASTNHPVVDQPAVLSVSSKKNLTTSKPNKTHNRPVRLHKKKQHRSKTPQRSRISKTHKVLKSPSSQKTKPAISEAPGRLRLSTTPWTTVYMGDRKLGVTPIVDLKLPAGTHVLRALNPAKGIDRKITVVINPSKTTIKTLRF